MFKLLQDSAEERRTAIVDPTWPCIASESILLCGLIVSRFAHHFFATRVPAIDYSACAIDESALIAEYSTLRKLQRLLCSTQQLDLSEWVPEHMKAKDALNLISDNDEAVQKHVCIADRIMYC